MVHLFFNHERFLMLICVGGDIHGRLDQFYRDIADFERSLGVKFDWALHVGDFGIWPDPTKADKATLKHGDIGDFPQWFSEKKSAPIPTAFIKGNHEDFGFLESCHKGVVLPNLFHIPNGRARELTCASEAGSIVVAGVGGCFGPSDYNRKSRTLQGYAKRHFTSDEIAALKPGADILLFHDAPAGVEFTRNWPGGRESKQTSRAEGIAEAILRVKPRVCFSGHWHRRVDYQIGGVPGFGLNFVGRPGNLVAIDIPVGGTKMTVLGEWPKHPQFAQTT
jgi:Icc-related predicted phosphoesterase